MINKEFVKNWITALRSNKYKQGYNQLFDGNGYCCLGIGVLVAQEMGCKEACTQDMSSKCPDALWWNDFTGLNTIHDLYANTIVEKRWLVDLNDLDKLSFQKIADFIEKTWSVNENLA